MGRPDCPFCHGGKCQKKCKDIGSSLTKSHFQKKKVAKLSDIEALGTKKLKKLKKAIKSEILSAKDEKEIKTQKKNLKAIKKKIKEIKTNK